MAQQRRTRQTPGQAARNARKRELQGFNRSELTLADRRRGTLAIIQLGQQSLAASLKAAEAQRREEARLRELEARAERARQAALASETPVSEAAAVAA